MNYQNKLMNKISSLSLSLSRENTLKVFKGTSVFLATIALVFGGFFAPQQAFAAAIVMPASGGTNISIDTTSASGGSGTYKTLSGPSIIEIAPEDISVGTHTITLPSGWEFNIGSTVTVFRTAGDIGPESQVITPSTNSFTFTITSASTENSALAFMLNSMEVRPTGTTPSTSNMTYSGAGIVGVVDGSTNFGTLSTVAGTVTKLAFTTEPGGAVYGSLLDPQPVVVTQDQFGNESTIGLGASLDVTLTLSSGGGSLIGDATLDIRTDAGSGTVTFTDLTVDEFGTGKQLTAIASGLTDAVSSNFEVTKKPLTATITADNKDYDGNTSTTITGRTLVGLEFGDIVIVTGGSATFDTKDIGTNKVVSATGLVLGSEPVAVNYTYDGTATGAADITAKPITVTPDVGQTKIYGNADPTLAYTFDPALISLDDFIGALSRDPGTDVGTYAYTIGTLANGLDNYVLILVPGTFGITQKDLTVTATGINKEYNADTIATVTLSSVDEEGGDNLVYDYTTASFLTKIAEDGKTVDVSGISISGAKASNYNPLATTAQTTANITQKSITATINLNNKTYNGNTNAVYSSTNPRVENSVIAGDVVVVENTGSKAFVDKHVGVGKTVNATGLTLSGADAGNYQFDGTGTGTATISQRPITVTAATDSRIYNGVNTSSGTPTVTFGTLGTGDALNFSQTYDNKNVGTGKTLTPSGVVIDGNPISEGSNYDVTFATVSTGEIIVKPINVTAQPDTKTYDGTISSNVAPTVDPLETVDLIGTAPTQSYDTKNIGTGKTLTASGLVINDGNSGLNYAINPVNNTTGVINTKELNVSGAITNSKPYDGGVNATVNFGGASLVGIVNAEDVTLNSDGFSATYDNKNVGTGKTVTVSGLVLDGTGASNYLLTQPVLTDGVINAKTLTVTATGIDRVYDAGTVATVTLGDDRVFLDDLALGYTASFTDKNVDPGKTVNVTDISIIGGTDAGNYVLGNATTDTTADITPATLTATITASNKTYDGNNTATIAGYVFNVIGADVVTENAPGTATFAGANVGVGKLVSATGITIQGTDAGNYSYNGTATGNADITPLGITGSFTAGNKVYNGNTTATVLTQSLTDVLAGDELNVSLTGGSAEFAGANVSNDIIVTELVAMNLTGSVAGNYELTDVVSTTANIIKAPLTIIAENKSKIYGDTNPALTASYVDFVGGEDASVLDTSVTLATLADETSPIGSYPIIASNAADTNYEITFISGTLTVTPAPLTVIADAQNKTYGDLDPILLTYTPSELVNGDTEAVFNGALERVDISENVGVYAITKGSFSAGDNYAINFTSADLTINRRALTVTAVTDTKVYDGTTNSAGIQTIIGDLQFGNAADFTQTYDNKNVGNGKILTAAGIVNDGNGGNNYSYDFSNTAIGEVTALEIVVTPDANQSKIYGATEPTFTYTFAPDLIGDDVFTGALSRVAGDDVGTYAYDLGTLSAGGNYALTLTSGTFEITKATPVITWGNLADIVYGTAISGTQLNATADVGGAFVYAPVLGTVLNAGEEQTLSAVFTPADIDNYNNIEPTALLTVTPAPLMVTAENKAKEYGADDPALTYTPSELVNGDTEAVFNGALERVVGEDVGGYSINQGTLSAGGNYEITPFFTSGTLTITDTVVPELVSHTPTVNAVNVAVASDITITFSESVVVESGDITLSPSTAFTVGGLDTSVITLTPASAWDDNTVYTATITTGVADVNGLPLGSSYSWSFTTATSYSIVLNADAGGWNLISLPVVPTNKNIDAVLGGAEGIIAVWTYDPANLNAVDGWLVYTGNPATSNLDVMTAGYGYWVDATSDTSIDGSGSLIVAGPTVPPSRNLVAGWNLVGYYQIPAESLSTVDNAFASIGGSAGMTGLWGFNNQNGDFTSVTTIWPGDAFWVSLPSVKVYTPSNL